MHVCSKGALYNIQGLLWTVEDECGLWCLAELPSSRTFSLDESLTWDVMRTFFSPLAGRLFSSFCLFSFSCLVFGL